MKLPHFEYQAPKSLEDAIALLAAGDGQARPIAGGQSFVPVMAFRLAEPSMLVDLRYVPGLSDIEITPSSVRIGAMVRWCDLLKDRRLAQAIPLLPAAIEHVAHYQVRNKGTVGGSLAHADPAAEMPAIALTCDATVHVVGTKGARTVAAADLFTGPLSTSLTSDEIITGVEFKAWPKARRWGFQEFARRRGDFALAGVAVLYDEDGQGLAQNVAIGAISVGDTPIRLKAAEAKLAGVKIDEASIAAAMSAASNEVSPASDIHASARYRKALVGTLLGRALEQASARKEF